MAELKTLLGSLPAGLRTPLIKEYKKLTQNYMEHRWEPAELSVGKLCEIVYSIINGHVDGNYPTSPSKPRNMVAACRQLENEASLPRSFQILIPRMLPALYEIRNNRGVGHVGGEVNANNVDATLMLTMVNWVMAELVRVFHTGSLEEAQTAVDALAQRSTPLIWDNKGFKKVLSPNINLKDQILLLSSSTDKNVSIAELMEWTESTNKTYYKKILKSLHKEKLVHFDEKEGKVTLLPFGSNKVASIVEQHAKT
ncbi:hypothetical protein [Halomonas sp. GD1P12]|uniref:hypothetical protein n=1 Tax=Halomonas sp. GD1P12 TaxID=2982691 RepID=UPI0021E4DC02|nr:hypothetical protein [Halomonas sp. GD1P12]UYG01257.1 hypothetical protein OCT39_06810 [Halomonas sp. GD1P12]